MRLNHELLREIISILSEDKISAVYSVTGKFAVSFAALIREMRIMAIDEALRRNEKIGLIAKRMGVSEKTVRRRFNALYRRPAKKHAQKK